MKTLANCKPSEFLRQTNRIKKSVEKWLTDTDIMNIRKNVAAPANITPGMSQEDKKAALDDYKKRQQEQAKKNLSRILDAVLDEHPDETLEVLALICFIEPEDADNHPMTEYMTAVTEMISDEATMGFFTSLARWGVLNTSN